MQYFLWKHHSTAKLEQSPFFLPLLVTGWFKGYCIWLYSNIVLSPDCGWPHILLQRRRKTKQLFFTSLRSWLYLTLGSHQLLAALLSPEHRNRSCAGSRGTSTTVEGKGNDRVSCHISRGKKQPRVPALRLELYIHHIFPDGGAPFHDYCLVSQSEFIQQFTKRAGGWSYQLNPKLL